MVTKIKPKNSGGEGKRGIDFPVLLVGISGVVHKILAQKEKNMVIKCYSGCFFLAILLLRAQP